MSDYEYVTRVLAARIIVLPPDWEKIEREEIRKQLEQSVAEQYEADQWAKYICGEIEEDPLDEYVNAYFNINKEYD